MVEVAPKNVFVMEIEEDGFRANPETGAMEPIEWVTYGVRGSGSAHNMAATKEKVSRIRKHMPDLWHAIQPSYEQWKSGREVPEGETSLASSALFSKSQIQMLNGFKIMSVEQMAALTDAHLSNIGLGALDMRTKARVFIQSREGDGKIAAAMAEKEQQMRAMKERMEELEASVKSLTSGKEDEKKSPPDQRGRGRPKKQHGEEVDLQALVDETDLPDLEALP